MRSLVVRRETACRRSPSTRLVCFWLKRQAYLDHARLFSHNLSVSTKPRNGSTAPCTLSLLVPCLDEADLLGSSSLDLSRNLSHAPPKTSSVQYSTFITVGQGLSQAILRACCTTSQNNSKALPPSCLPHPQPHANPPTSLLNATPSATNTSHPLSPKNPSTSPMPIPPAPPTQITSSTNVSTIPPHQHPQSINGTTAAASSVRPRPSSERARARTVAP